MSQGLARRSLHVLLDNRNSAAHSTQTYLSVLQLLLRLRNRTCGERQIGASLRRPLKRAPVTTSGTDSRRMSWWPHRVKAGSAPFCLEPSAGGDSMCRRSTVRTRSTAPVPFDGCGPSAPSSLASCVRRAAAHNALLDTATSYWNGSAGLEPGRASRGPRDARSANEPSLGSPAPRGPQLLAQQPVAMGREPPPPLLHPPTCAGGRAQKRAVARGLRVWAAGAA